MFKAAILAIAELLSTDSDERHCSFPRPSLPERSSVSRPEVILRKSLNAEQSSPRRRMSVKNCNKSDDNSKEIGSVAVSVRTIQRLLSTIGRTFSDTRALAQTQQHQTPLDSEPLSEQ
jgi:hypothetical protein